MRIGDRGVTGQSFKLGCASGGVTGRHCQWSSEGNFPFLVHNNSLSLSII